MRRGVGYRKLNIHAVVAQPAEQLIRNQQVVGYRLGQRFSRAQNRGKLRNRIWRKADSHIRRWHSSVGRAADS